MNLNDNPTIEQLRDLVRQGDDWAGHHVLWVRRSGEVELSRLPKGQTPFEFQQSHQNMQMRFEAFQGGNEYVGPEAAANDEWMHEAFNRLVQEWAAVKDTAGVRFLDVSGTPVESHFAWR